MYMAVADCATCPALGAWYDIIVETVGEVGADAAARIRAELERRYGAEIWQSLPEQTRQSAIAAAWDDVQSRVNWPLLLAGGAALFFLLRR